MQVPEDASGQLPEDNNLYISEELINHVQNSILNNVENNPNNTQSNNKVNDRSLYATVKLRTIRRRNILKLNTKSLVETNKDNGRELVFSSKWNDLSSNGGLTVDDATTPKRSSSLKKRVSFLQVDKPKIINKAQSLDVGPALSDTELSSSEYSTPMSTPNASRTPSFKEEEESPPPTTPTQSRPPVGCWKRALL